MKSPQLFLTVICNVLLYAASGIAAENPVYPSRITIDEKLAAQREQEELKARNDLICRGVTCSGYGRCVVQNEQPACACNPGLLPDPETGLHCIPAQLRVVPRSVPQGVCPVGDLQRSVNDAGQKRQIQQDAARAAMKLHPDYKNANIKTALGITGIFLGGAGMLAGLMLKEPHSVPMDFNVSNAGWIVFGASFAVFVPSFAVRQSARGDMNRIFKEELDRQQESTMAPPGRGTPMAMQESPGTSASIRASVHF